MIQDALHYLIVYGLSMFKFVLGPAMGHKYELGFLETTVLTSLGMMTSVYFFTSVLGSRIHSWIKNTFYKNKRLFSSRNRRTVKIWRSFGLIGVAFLTPIIFSPIGGAIVATSFGERRRKIFAYMFASAVFWAAIFSLVSVNLNLENLFAGNN